ncbi:protein PRRC2A-like [Erinaceus europaeus]|uniref:Protein PRRC2A-like n=1 Tax=Erinaceus europaeus TaxID=9365 RepID=A0ABM3YBG3_ERIEU|nr:protein PRRC2A-like [Erinaceus europaeus]
MAKPSLLLLIVVFCAAEVYALDQDQGPIQDPGLIQDPGPTQNNRVTELPEKGCLCSPHQLQALPDNYPQGPGPPCPRIPAGTSACSLGLSRRIPARALPQTECRNALPPRAQWARRAPRTSHCLASRTPSPQSLQNTISTESPAPFPQKPPYSKSHSHSPADSACELSIPGSTTVSLAEPQNTISIGFPAAFSDRQQNHQAGGKDPGPPTGSPSGPHSMISQGTSASAAFPRSPSKSSAHVTSPSSTSAHPLTHDTSSYPPGTTIPVYPRTSTKITEEAMFSGSKVLVCPWPRAPQPVIDGPPISGCFMVDEKHLISVIFARRATSQNSQPVSNQIPGGVEGAQPGISNPPPLPASSGSPTPQLPDWQVTDRQVKDQQGPAPAALPTLPGVFASQTLGGLEEGQLKPSRLEKKGQLRPPGPKRKG